MGTLDQIGTMADNVYEQIVNFSRIKAGTFIMSSFCYD